MRENRLLTRQQILLRISAGCLVMSSILLVAMRTLHGDLPADQGAAASLSYVAAHPLYPIFHLGDAFGFLLFAGGLVALAESLTDRVAWAIGRLGMVCVLIGTAVHVVEFPIDGFGLPMLAHAWAVAPSSERLGLELATQTVLAILGGPGIVSLTFVWGASLVVYGLALEREGYSKWLAWVGIVLGVVILVMGSTFYLKPNSYPGVLLFGGGTLAVHLWALGLGLSAWRRAGMHGLSVVQSPDGAGSLTQSASL